MENFIFCAVRDDLPFLSLGLLETLIQLIISKNDVKLKKSYLQY